VCSVANRLCGIGVSRVLRAELCNVAEWDGAKLTGEEGALGEEPCEKATTELGEPDNTEPFEVLGPFSLLNVDSKRDSRVKVATSDAAEDNDAGSKREGNRNCFIRQHDSIDE